MPAKNKRAGRFFIDYVRKRSQVLPSTPEMEREHGLVHVIVDQPQGTTFSIPPIWEVTTPQLAMVRFHGRNAETWQKKGLASAAERFNYLYSDEELEELAPKVKALENKVEKVHALFNNCHGDKGVRNGATFRHLLHYQTFYRLDP